MPLRILHTPTLTGNHPGTLARAERAVGLDSSCISLYGSRFGFATDEQLWQEGDGLLRKEWKRWALLWRAIRQFDVIHFNFGRSLAPPLVPWSEYHHSFPKKNLKKLLYCLYARLVGVRDVWLLKKLGKKIVVTFQGDDCRINEYFAAHCTYHICDYSPLEYRTPAWDALRRRNTAMFAKHADIIYALNPDLLRVLPAHAQFLPYANVDIRQWQPVYGPQLPECPLVIHAPSQRNVKGTDYVLAAVETLRAEGVSFRFQLVEDMAHDKVQALYAQSDLLIDQLRAGWYGGLAVELMSLGKPVIAYMREEDMARLPTALREALPVINANPDTITDVLRQWLTNRKGELAQRGRDSRRFVEAWHDPQVIAQKLKDDYQRLGAGV